MKTLKELMPTLRSIKSRDAEFDWTLELLKDCLHTALTIEFATIPPYLNALWSIKVIEFPSSSNSYQGGENYEAYKSIRTQISEEEMIHMGLVCNLLVALGETPSLRANPPSYPGQLPGQLAGEATVSLQGYSKEALQVFLDIEFPQEGPINIANDPQGQKAAKDNVVVDSAKTIGEFYDSIVEGFETVFTSTDTFPTEKQLEHDINRPPTTDFPKGRGVFKIENLDDVRSAITLIKRQGEGSSSDGAPSPGDESAYDLAHYYRFLELHRERKIQETSQESGEFEFIENEKYEFPEDNELYHITDEASTGGYENENTLDQDVQDNLHNFDIVYTDMLRYIEEAWRVSPSTVYPGKSRLYLNWAVGKMYELKPIAQALMEKGYGPCFRIVENTEIPPLHNFPDVETVEPNPTWEGYIKDLMTDNDIRGMQSYFDLTSCEQVRDNATGIINRVSRDEEDGSLMPKGGPRWPQAWIDSFQNWIDNGFVEN